MTTTKGGTMNDKLIWIDLETTGLDPKDDSILEVACVITDKDLNELDRYEGVITDHAAQRFSTGKRVDVGVYEMHTMNGLINEIRLTGPIGSLTAEQALHKVGELIGLYEAGGSVLAGSNVSFDRAFIESYKSRVPEMLHYGNLDVSSVRRFMELAYPDMAPFEKAKAHRAMADIRESIAELKYYRGIAGGAK